MSLNYFLMQFPFGYNTWNIIFQLNYYYQITKIPNLKKKQFNHFIWNNKLYKNSTLSGCKHMVKCFSTRYFNGSCSELFNQNNYNCNCLFKCVHITTAIDRKQIHGPHPNMPWTLGGGEWRGVRESGQREWSG